MTSQKQIEANRRNALLSTGPQTEEGKDTSRQNALRHGLTAETVIDMEDAAEYAAFEAEILAEYDPQSLIERELTLRLASLSWRLRRANLIETGLLQIQCEPTCDDNGTHPAQGPNVQLLKRVMERFGSNRSKEAGPDMTSAHTANKKRAITDCFMRLAELPSAPFERIGRYEAALWRQFVQALFALDEAKRHRLVASRRRFTPYPPQW